MGLVLKKRVIISWTVLVLIAAAIGLLAWFWVGGTCAREYVKAQMLIQDGVDAYRGANDGAMPVFSDVVVTLEEPEGTFLIIDMCALAAMDKEFEHVMYGCAEVDGDGNDNCDGGSCSSCNSTHHYLWLVDFDGRVLSMCVGAECDYNNEDGYQGVWP